MLEQWAGFWRAPWRLRVHVLVLGVLAVIAAIQGPAPAAATRSADGFTALVLLAVAAFHVESARSLVARFGYPLQPFRALPAWALASALLLPAWWLLVVVPVTTLHACRRDRSMRRGFRWVPAGAELVLCGLAGNAVARWIGDRLVAGADADARVVVVLLSGATSFLLVETALGQAARLLRISGVRWWVRGRRLTRGGLPGEVTALVAGSLLVAAWTLGPWLGSFVIAATLLVQHARLLLPLRARLDVEEKLLAENVKLTALVDTLETRNAELDELIRFKTDLMSMLGHEISNPLTSVLGFSQIGLAAAADDDAGAARSALRTVERNARKVADVVSDIRQLVASERGGITASPEPVTLEPRLRAAIDDRARARRPELRCPPGLAVRVQPGHLDQIMANLLSNATKYGGGATDVQVDEVTGEPFVTVSVADAGPGVPDADRDHLFERYWRDARIVDTIPGTGIGLFISRELARANGGDLAYAAGSPAGSRFVLTLARADAPDSGV